MFELPQGLKLALYSRADLALDAKVAVGASSATECTLGYFVRSREEVDAVMRQAEQAGATITDRAHDRPWGIYSGYFQDPDGHLWEVVCYSANGRRHHRVGLQPLTYHIEAYRHLVDSDLVTHTGRTNAIAAV
jgi:hypothetical protein